MKRQCFTSKPAQVVMRILILLLMAAASLRATNLTGTFKQADGSPVNGKLIFLLSQPARLNDQSAQIVPMVKIFSVTNGQLEGGAFVFGNDVLVPGGTYYLVRLVDANNNLLFEQKWSISGASLDLGTLTPTTTGVVLPDPLIKNVTVNQAVQGPVTFSSGISAFSLTLNGNLQPGTSETNDLGAPSLVWRELFARKWGATLMPGTLSGSVTPPNTAPAMTLESASGGTINAGVWYAVITYGNRNGETTQSPQASLVVSGNSNQILLRVADLKWITGAYKWRVYVGNTSGGPYYLQTPKTVSFAVANNGFTRASNVVTVTTSANHGITRFGQVTIAGATGCATAPNGTFTVTDIPSATSFTFAQTAGNETCGGASATASYIPRLDANNWWYVGNSQGTSDIILDTITLSGTQPPTVNTAVSNALNASMPLDSSLNRNGKLRLLSSTYVVDTPLVLYNAATEGQMAMFTDQACPVNASVITSSWTDPTIATVMVMGPYVTLRNLCVAAANSNAIMAVSGSHNMNGLYLDGVFASITNTNTDSAPIRIHKVAIGQGWTFNNVTANGGRYVVYASNSNVAYWDWYTGRTNCGTDNASSAFVNAAGPPDLSRGAKNVFDAVPSSISLTLYRHATESCKGVVWDWGGGLLSLRRGTQNADGVHPAGIEAIVRLWSDNWSKGGSLTGFELDQSSILFGSGNVLATIKLGPGGSDYGTNMTNRLSGTVGPSTGSGSEVSLDMNNLGWNVIIDGTEGPRADPLSTKRKVINVAAATDGIQTVNAVGKDNASAIPIGWNEFRDRIVLRQTSARSRRKTFSIDQVSPFNLQLLNSDDVTVDAEWHATGGHYKVRGLIRGGTNPADSAFASGSIFFGSPNNLWYSVRNAANTADVDGWRINSGQNFEFCGTNCVASTTAKQIISTLATGTAPLSITSTTLVPNLNAEQWNGKTAIDFSAPLDFGSITPQTCSELTITATGAVADNPIAPSWPVSLEAGLTGIMYVSASNTVTVRLCNVTAGAIDPASRTFAGRVVK